MCTQPPKHWSLQFLPHTVTWDHLNNLPCTLFLTTHSLSLYGRYFETCFLALTFSRVSVAERLPHLTLIRRASTQNWFPLLHLFRCLLYLQVGQATSGRRVARQWNRHTVSHRAAQGSRLRTRAAAVGHCQAGGRRGPDVQGNFLACSKVAVLERRSHLIVRTMLIVTAFPKKQRLHMPG